MKEILQGLFFSLVTAAFFLFYPAEKKTVHPLSRGWGADIDWVQSYEEGLFEAQTRDKPLMVIHHLMDCPYSKALKEAFSQHEEIQSIAKVDFIMMNVMHETADSNLAPDGYYVPRIIFVDPTMTVRTDLVGNVETLKYTYSQDDLDKLLENMKKAVSERLRVEL
ncbi:anterior gradient protein 3-like [Acipenser oxyrinchus oxyrinchus]|uniref:Anterior gradient protein 3-like n=1 Tax=Acipenser oxyrinchus oxyrinchus TaxID=40147 RepID=A0AAD8DA29_ACIOX|nr:anterior gradient protein 3-like [Acipenser oxyrinchus oxyrinchus]